MPAALLQDNAKYNELEDNPESSLDLRGWTALCFTNRTISGGGSSLFIRAFDEQYKYEDGIKGKDLKREFFATPSRKIPRVAEFNHCAQLDALVETFTVCYLPEAAVS